MFTLRAVVILLVLSIIPKSMAQDEFNVVLDNFGPEMRICPPVEAPAVRARPIELPPVHLPYYVPRPRTVKQRCRCVKTILRSQQVLQLIRIPVIRKYLQTITRPVVQRIAYQRRAPCI